METRLELEQILLELSSDSMAAVKSTEPVPRFDNVEVSNYVQKAVTKLEALLSQHSKKRELEWLQKLKLDNNGYGGDSAYHNAPFYVVPLSEIDDRIEQLGGQNATKE